jgi:hypothetical protein
VAGRPKRRARIAAGLPIAKGNGTRPAFEPGNQAHLSHGGYRTVGLSERAGLIADEIRPSLPAYSPADEPVLHLLATALARIENANAAMAVVDENATTLVGPYLGGGKDGDLGPGLQRLREDLRRWVETARRLANDLGLTPTSRARLGLDIASTQRTLSVIDYYQAREAAGLPLYDDEPEEAA